MNERLGLRGLVRRHRRGEHDEIEEERYDDLRDAEGMIDLTAYATGSTRQTEAFNYIELASALLDREHGDVHPLDDAEDDWPAA
jgi:hypothetical protein